MCGIAGVVSRDPEDRASPVLYSMLEAIAHRGPDEVGTAVTSNASLGARRLAIIDLAGGRQPMANETQDVFAVQNGEIYNFEQLRSELGSRGHVFRTRNDTEVLPHAYEEWGDALVSRLHGMFALAIWDDQRRRLLLARDRFGKKPLLYAPIPAGIAFASEMQALLRHPAIDSRIDDLAVDAYLGLGYVPAPLSAFVGVRKLPAAHTLTLQDGRIVVERYWRLRAQPKLSLSLPEAAEELRGRIDEAVRLRLKSDVPLGVFLSGGLDSSTVAAFMSRHLDKVRTFSIGFADERLNELPHARAVARALGTDHQELIVDAQDVEALPMLIRHVGEPFADPSIVPTYQLARITRPHVKVALTGDGGDELLLGYDRYRAAMVARWLTNRLGPRFTGPIARFGAALTSGRGAPFAVARIARFLAGLRTGGHERYLRWSGYFTDELRDGIVGERLSARGAVASEIVARYYGWTGSSEAERYAFADLELHLPGDMLTKMDIATMAASLEARSPLLDHELAEFVARLPTSYKMTLTTSKVVLRTAMAGLLPNETLRRGKSGFVPPVDTWLRGPLRPLFEDLVPSGEAVRSGWVTRAGVRRAYNEHMSGRTDRSLHLWNLLVLEIWWREAASMRPVGLAGAVSPEGTTRS